MLKYFSNTDLEKLPLNAQEREEESLKLEKEARYCIELEIALKKMDSILKTFQEKEKEKEKEKE